MVKGFVNALLISGIKIGRVVSYVQFSYEILKIIYELYRSSNSSIAVAVAVTIAVVIATITVTGSLRI